MAYLGVNIDHVATLRQARGENSPSPVEAAQICLQAGADSIVAHLREDRRHIQDKDVKTLRKTVTKRFNLEMSLNPEIVAIAAKLQPEEATLVPEKRRELTTEGGLDVITQFNKVSKVVQTLQDRGIEVSLFIDPVKKQILTARESGARAIELHTGRYDRAASAKSMNFQFNKIKNMTAYAKSLGLTVNAGHGLKYHNTRAIARIPGMNELNIGHSIISRAVFVGLTNAVREMKALVTK
jgi:pyridoxine 5-phosphate synthase